MQPKMPTDLARLLNQAGLSASCYQPVTMFPKDGRKLPNVPIESDPWECFLRREGSPWVEARATGATLRAAVEAAVGLMLPGGGLKDAMARLETECHRLTCVLHACQN